MVCLLTQMGHAENDTLRLSLDDCIDATKFVRDYVIDQFYDGDIKNTPKNFENCFYLGNYNDGEFKIAIVYNEVR